MLTKILKIKGSWQEVLDDCRATVKKIPLGKEPSEEFKKTILIAEHSPIRDIEVKFTWKDIPYWVAMHWKTHHWESRVNSQRNDRQTAYNRAEAPQSTPVDFTGEMNTQHMIDTMRKRLCHKAAKETREYAEDFKTALFECEPEISNVLVPNCVYRGGCSEIKGCNFWNKFYEYEKMMHDVDVGALSIQERYDCYNDYYYSIYKDKDKEKENVKP
jgi:hypothetical protein